MAKSRRFSTTALIITTMAVLITTAALVIWLPTPEERAQRRASEAFSRAYAELSSVRIGPIRWSGLTLEQAVADVNAQLEKKGETDLRLFVSADYAAQASPAISMQLEDVLVTECAWYLCDLSFASMSGSREGITFGPLRCFPPPPPWRIRVRHWVSYNLWERWKAKWSAPASGASGTTPGATPPTPPASTPASPAGADPFAPAGAP
jgi:hypothetical protein